MASVDGDFLTNAAVFLGAAAVTVPIFQRMKLGSILGYLAAGIIIGPSGLGLVAVKEDVFHIAELGVVLFMFIIGLELSLSRLWSWRRDILGLGAAQMAVTGIIIAGIFVRVEVMPARAAIVAGAALAFSSTAFALQYLKDRGELNSGYGARAFPVLLFQDLAVIPLLAAIPFLAGGEGGLGWIDGGKMVLVLAVLFGIGRYGLDSILRMVAGSGSREAFAATALFVVAATALAVSWAGLSMALGAFLAGALLAESTYRRQIETDIEPVRGLLLGLFFISIGMRLDLHAIFQHWWIVLGGAVGLVALKTALLYGLARLFGAGRGDALKTGAVLSQGGEFAFVALSLGVGAGMFTDAQVTLLSAIVTISMAMTPLLMLLVGKLTDREPERDAGDMEGPQSKEEHVIIAGFGRMGQIISQVLQNSGIAITAIDRDPGHIRNASRFGFKVYYGDASRLDLMEAAGVARAKAVILCIDDPKAVNASIAGLRERFPTLTILAVAHDRFHEITMQRLGPDVIVRETLESSLLIAREALARFGHDQETVDDIIQEFRSRDRERLLAQIDYGDEAASDLIHKPFGSLNRGDSA